MNVERLRKIIAYSKQSKDDFEERIKSFYAWNEMLGSQETVNVPQVVKDCLWKKGYMVLEIPFQDKEIGALCYRGDAIGYIVLNSSLPRATVNFAICHEVYHVFFQKECIKTKVELAEGYYDQEEEFAANLFAGMLLMPETSFRFMYNKFNRDAKGTETHVIAQLMNYYRVPYMAVLIRCYELGLLEGNQFSERLLNLDSEEIRKAFRECWLDESVLNATQRDDYDHLKYVVQRLGKEYIQGEYISERTVDYVLENMDRLYVEIKGE